MGIGYTSNKVIDLVRQALKDDIKSLYKCKAINWKGNEIPKGKPLTEIIAKELNNSGFIGRLETITVITREKGYKCTTHNGQKTTGNGKTNRKEEEIALDLFNSAKIFEFGKVIDYQVPLKNKSSDDAGKIDLVTEKENTIYMIELKREDSKETLLRCMLEIATYYQILDKEKFLENFGKKGYNIEKGILIYKDSQEYTEWREALSGERPELKKLLDSMNIKVFTLD